LVQPVNSNRWKMIETNKHEQARIYVYNQFRTLPDLPHNTWTKMVFGIFLTTARVPTSIGINKGFKGTRDHDEHRQESTWQQRCHLSVECTPLDGSLQQALAIHNAKVYLGPDKMGK
jgi:hypothetical protein